MKEEKDLEGSKNEQWIIAKKSKNKKEKNGRMLNKIKK